MTNRGSAVVLGIVGLAWLGVGPRATEPQTPAYLLDPVPITAVRFTDEFWKPRLDRNRTNTIQHIARQNGAELLGGVVALSGSIPSSGPSRAARRVTAIPYFAWANRGPGEMTVWIPYRKQP